MPIGLMIYDIIMNLFTYFKKQTTDSVKKDLFSKIQDDTIYLYKGYLQYYLWEDELMIQNDVTFASFH